MAKIKLNGDTSGYIEISAPAVSGNNTLELGPGTKILTNLDNTFTGVSTFSSDVYLGNDIYLTDGSSGYERIEVDQNDIRVTGKHIHSQFGVWTRSTSVGNRRNGIEGDNNDLLLYANGGEKVRITSNGNIGVGGETGTDYSLLDGIVTNTANGSAGLLINSSSSSHNAYMSFGYGSGSGTSHADQFSAYIGRVGDNTLILGTDNNIRLRLDPSGHLLHGVTADEDTSGNGGLRFINSGDIQIDGDQKALVFRSTNNTAQLQSAIEWWNENGAGVQAKISCDRTAVSQAPSDLVFYTSSNVDLGGAGSDGAITERLRIRSDGRVTIGAQVINTNSMLSIHRGSSDESQIRFTNTTTGEGGNNGLLVGIDSNEHGRIFNQENTPLRFGTNNTERVRISSDGKFGIGVQSPFSRFQSGGHTFSGGNGMYSNDRVGMSNHGQLTGLMLASTYNDGAHPEYGLVFVQGPNTSSYNVWSLSPDGPNKGNSLNFHYDDQATNIHSPSFRKFQMTGEGYFLQPYQPKFRAGRNGSYTPGAGSDIIFNTVSGGGKHNIGGHYNTSNGRFTAPVAGVYTFTIHVIWESLSSGQNMADCFHPKINGTVVGYSGRRGEYIANETGNNGYYTDFMTYQYTLAANDYVTVNNQFNLTIHGNSNYTTFSGHLVG